MLTARGGARRGVMTEKLKDSDIDQAIIDEYEIGETLGTGHFSKVKLGIDRKTGEKVAIKASFCPPPLPASTGCCCLQQHQPIVGLLGAGAPHLQIIVKPTGSKIAMLKTEVDIMTKTAHPNVYVAPPATRHHPLARTGLFTLVLIRTAPPISGLRV